MKYLVYTLIQILVVLGLANLCLAFVPRPIRKAFQGTFKLACSIVKHSIRLLKVVVKKAYANYKEIEQPSKKPSNKKTKSNVVQFPKKNIQ